MGYIVISIEQKKITEWLGILITKNPINEMSKIMKQHDCNLYIVLMYNPRNFHSSYMTRI